MLSPKIPSLRCVNRIISVNNHVLTWLLSASEAIEGCAAECELVCLPANNICMFLAKMFTIHQSQHSVVWRGAWAHGSVRIWQLPILMWIRLFECWFKKPCRFCNFIQYFLKNLELCEVWTGPCTILLPHIIFLALIKQNFDNSLFFPLIYKNSCSF